ncbi:hypothetical protein D920_00404 [Enterococcus faecalis 13-SD-W-01]|nr:hypothetical protein D920_00404 [Enterococcus faecalis 13-SD-W-01]
MLVNIYELALQLPEVVIVVAEELGLVKGKDTSHKVQDSDTYIIQGIRKKSTFEVRSC